MKHVSSEEKAEILRAHGWVDNASGGWHRVSGDSDSGMGVSQAFNLLGNTNELERKTLFEFGWKLLPDEMWTHDGWTHDGLTPPVKLGGPTALLVQAKLEACLETAYQNLTLAMAENLAKNTEIKSLHLEKRFTRG